MLAMNKLDAVKRAQILSMLVEGSSLRSTARVCDVTLNTVLKLLVTAGQVCERFHHETVRGLQTANLQCDEIWSFCYAKKKTVKQMPADKFNADAGDVWTFTALDRDSKMMVSWYVGDRDTATAADFLQDAAARIATPQGKSPARRYSPGVCVGAERKTIFGNTNHNMISTSHVERMNLNMRMGMRRFTRLTNAFSKKLNNHCYALALYFVWYNFCKIHKTLKTTPAMAAGITDELMDMGHIVQLIELAEGPAKKRGPYKKPSA
jgi:IS1 family transposase